MVLASVSFRRHEKQYLNYYSANDYIKLLKNLLSISGIIDAGVQKPRQNVEFFIQFQ